MVDENVVWPAEKHTRAKHAILARYLSAWVPILSRQLAREESADQPLYVDAFAGPGIYAGGEPGSPIVALEAALGQPELPTPVQFMFIEKNEARYRSLNEQIGRLKPRLNECRHIYLHSVVHGDAVQALTRLIADRDAKNVSLGPALFFLDQFGYTDVPMELIRTIMAHDRCEVFTYLNYNFLQRFLDDPTKDTGRDAAFGTPAWRDALNRPKDQQYQTLLDRYRAALHDVAGAKYVWQFAMRDRHEKPLYWLFFATNNIRGLEVMKRAMWGVDRLGTFSFTDADVEQQQMLIDLYTDDWLMQSLRDHFAGQTVKVEQIRDYVLAETPCYKYADVLQRMDDVVPADGRGRVAYTTDMDRLVRFEGGLFSF